MSQIKLEKRVVALEKEVARLTEQVGSSGNIPWWKKISGAFADDPIYDEAMRLGREYRESLRPSSRPKTKTKAKNGNSRHRSGNPHLAKGQ